MKKTQVENNSKSLRILFWGFLPTPQHSLELYIEIKLMYAQTVLQGSQQVASREDGVNRETVQLEDGRSSV